MFSMYDQCFFPPLQGVIFVSDSQIKDLKFQSNQHDLKILEKQRNEIDAAISELNNEIQLISPSKAAEAVKK